MTSGANGPETAGDELRRSTGRGRRAQRPHNGFSAVGIQEALLGARRISASPSMSFSVGPSAEPGVQSTGDDIKAVTAETKKIHSIDQLSERPSQASVRSPSLSLFRDGEAVSFSSNRPDAESPVKSAGSRAADNTSLKEISRKASLIVLRPDRLGSTASVHSTRSKARIQRRPSGFSHVDLSGQRQRLESSLSDRSPSPPRSEVGSLDRKRLETPSTTAEKKTPSTAPQKKAPATHEDQSRLLCAPAQQAAALKLQAWWRGRTTRTLITASLIERRLETGGPTVRDLGQPQRMPCARRGRPTGTKLLNAPLHGQLSSVHQRLPPWPRGLVRTLCDFLDSLKAPQDGESRGAPAHRTSCRASTMAQVYNRHIKQAQAHSVFRVEDKALRQLRISKARRDMLSKELEDTQASLSSGYPAPVAHD